MTHWSKKREKLEFDLITKSSLDMILPMGELSEFFKDLNSIQATFIDIPQNSKKILSICFAASKTTNPFSRQMTLSLTEVAKKVQNFPDVGAVLLHGGANRSFSAGGDFKDVSALKEDQEIRSYLREIVELYISLLKIEVPIVAAVEGFAIGQGLQIALLADWRVASNDVHMQMPELKNGIACPLGTLLLNAMFSRAVSLEMCMGCEKVSFEKALSFGLIQEGFETSDVFEKALAKAKFFATFPQTPMRMTKRMFNQKLISELQNHLPQSEEAHVASFLERAGHTHFEKILGKTS